MNSLPEYSEVDESLIVEFTEETKIFLCFFIVCMIMILLINFGLLTHIIYKQQNQQIVHYICENKNVCYNPRHVCMLGEACIEIKEIL